MPSCWSGNLPTLWGSPLPLIRWASVQPTGNLHLHAFQDKPDEGHAPGALHCLGRAGNYKGQTSGLCGNFNDNPKDDLQQPDGSLTADLNVFTGSWEVHFPGIKCERGCIGHNCMANDKTDKCPDAMSSQGCLPLINGNAFKQCRAKVDPRVYYDNCAADSCTSKGDPKVVCDNMAAYALRCHLSGIKVNWRTDKLCRKLYARHTCTISVTLT
jgi:hypothetical protein